MRRTLPAAAAKAQLAAALRQAESGDLVVITRYGKPAAALVGADQLALLEKLQAEKPPGVAAGRRQTAAASDETPGPAEAGDRPAHQATPEELLERAASGCLRRIDYDLAKLPEDLRPVLVLVRANLFHPRLTVERIKGALGLGAHDVTSRFRQITGLPIRRYFEDRRLECACGLLLATELDPHAIARLVGYRGFESFARAFKRRHGLRPGVYREFGGRLSQEAANEAAEHLPPPAPRFLAGVAAVAPGTRCTRCRGGLEPRPALRVFEHLGPICAACARRHAPELGALLEKSTEDD